jgi:release factor glutamine methyltransferase
MLDAISNIPLEKKEVLDVGTGSGILGLFCALRGASMTATDVDETALAHVQKAARTLGVSLKTVLSDLFSNVDGRFDLVLFNPPYLPSAALEDRTVDGGKRGVGIMKRFLETLPKHLKAEGSALLLLSSLNDPSSLIAEHPDFDFSVTARRSLFFEEVQVLHLRFR